MTCGVCQHPLLQVLVELSFDAIDDHRGTLFRVPGDVRIDFRIDVPWHGIGMAEAIVKRPLKRPGIPWAPFYQPWNGWPI